MAELETDATDETKAIDPTADPAPRRCVVCGESLTGRERKVHAGLCATLREASLQTARRRRARLARPFRGH